MKEEHLAYVSREVLNALVYMHSNRHMHRDLKGSNIVLDLDGSVRLTDMGTAVDLSGEDDDDTSVSNIVGTKYFMAPGTYSIIN